MRVQWGYSELMVVEEEEVGGEGSGRREYKTITSSCRFSLQLYYCVKFYVKNDFGHPGELLYTMTSIFIRKHHFSVS